MNRSQSILLTLCLAVATAACGVTAQQAPVQIPDDQVPYRLLEAAPPTTTAPSGPASVTIYLVAADGRLTPVTRQVPAATLSDTLDALLAGPTQGEVAAGLATNLVGVTAEVREVDQVAVVDIGELPSTGTAETYTPYAQIVYTLTAALEGVDTVRFTLDGDPVAVPQGDGSLTDSPVSRASYPE